MNVLLGFYEYLHFHWFLYYLKTSQNSRFKTLCIGAFLVYIALKLLKWWKNTKNKKSAEFENILRQIMDMLNEDNIQSMCIVCIMCIV